MAIIKDFKKYAVLAARTAADKKAVDPIILDLRHTSDLADYVLIVGAESSAQMRAIDEAVEHALRDVHVRLLRRDGKPKNRWLVLDYGGFVMHILLPEARDFYRLENLWEEAKPVKWE